MKLKFPEIKSVDLDKIFDRFFPENCKHKWELHKTVKVYDRDYHGSNDLPVYRIYVLQCKKCGDVKEKKIGG